MVNKTVLDLIKELKEKGEVLPATSDVIFKNLFQDEDMKGIIAFIISEITLLDKNEILENMTFKNTEHSKEKINEKGKLSDVVVEVNNNFIILEMNSIYNKGTRLKNDAYHRKVASEKYNAGLPYEEDMVVIINFNNKQKYDSRKIIKYVMMDEERHTVYDNNFINYHINLAKFNQMYYNGDKLNRFEKIIVMMGLKKKEELWKLSKGDKELEKMAKKIEDMSDNPEVLPLSFIERMEEVARVVNLEEAKKEGLEKGIKEGIEEGRKKGIKEGIKEGKKEGKKEGQRQEKIEIAKSMLQDNMNVDIIAKYTGLTKTEIEDLK